MSPAITCVDETPYKTEIILQYVKKYCEGFEHFKRQQIVEFYHPPGIRRE